MYLLNYNNYLCMNSFIQEIEMNPNSVNKRSHCPSFPDEVLEKVLSFIDCHKDRNSLSLVKKEWYNIERWSRFNLFIPNCYSVTPEIVSKRFPRIKSVTIKGKPSFSDFRLLPKDWGANVHHWLVMFAKVYPFLEELRLKRMTVDDRSLEMLAKSFSRFKVLSLSSCDGFTHNGLKYIAAHCRNLTELDIQDCIVDYGGEGCWLSCFPENFSSLEVLNFSSINTEISFNALERLVSCCKSLRVLKVNMDISLDQLQLLLMHAPQLVELGTGSFLQELSPSQYEDVEKAFSNCTKLEVLSGLLGAVNLAVIYPVCPSLTFLNMTSVQLPSAEFENLMSNCSNLRRLWVLDSVGDEGLIAVGSNCHLLEELRVFPQAPYTRRYARTVTERGFTGVSRGCRQLRYVLYFCSKMTNEAVATFVRNCPDLTHFHLCLLRSRHPDYISDEPLDEAVGAVVKTCINLQKLSVSGRLTDEAFENIGKYAKNLITLSLSRAGSSTARGMQCVLNGCPTLKKLEARDSLFGDATLLSEREKYEKMRWLCLSTSNVSMEGCRLLSKEMPRLNVEIIKEESCASRGEKVYVYPSLAGPRRDAPPSVLTL